ncbi:hypothetical protein OJF2_00380 [Aquisphaera giovannonii]|uniref:DUF1842 domain-containing protein n=1 Tax=Aquisphaera giovannonii TaxID=406548 RepID=A0A5B9VT83_9BACT|nr:DUF1842 domain-containing protein [Aquisphaera giovannonii]QEH31573.1 hypothetical protein OJF2_00380 [Aquisphaera giovannonii]
MSPTVGLFLITWSIGTAQPGAPTLTLACTVNTPHEVLNGMGVIQQAINPPLDFHTYVHGTYTDMTVMPDKTHILVVATGFPVQQPVILPPGHIGPAFEPNFHLRMVLDKDFKSGVANFQYLDGQGWHKVKNAPVKVIPNAAAPGA